MLNDRLMKHTSIFQSMSIRKTQGILISRKPSSITDDKNQCVLRCFTANHIEEFRQGCRHRSVPHMFWMNLLSVATCHTFHFSPTRGFSRLLQKILSSAQIWEQYNCLEEVFIWELFNKSSHLGRTFKILWKPFA